MSTMPSSAKYIYFVGIKGAGMTGLAVILQGLGYKVEGSDISDTFFTDDILKKEGIAYRENFDPQNIPDRVDCAVVSNAYLFSSKFIRRGGQNSKLQSKNVNFEKNIELLEFEKRGTPIISYPEALAHFFNQAKGIAVTGTHGKSTTAAMISYILEQAGKDPFALVGAELLNWKSNARVPQSFSSDSRFTIHDSFFIIEADEYREQFLHYKPEVITVTNIDYDHTDYFATPKAYRKAFDKFKAQIKSKGFVVENKKESRIKNYKLRIIGMHNQENAHLAYLTCKKLGIDEHVIKKALKNYQGLRRRLERVGEYNNAEVIDDYAHHPTEIEAALSALKKVEPQKKIMVLFHPHTYSRTKAFLKHFAKSLTIADEVYLLDVYGSAREAQGEVNSDSITEEIRKLGRDAINLHTIDEAIIYFHNRIQRNDILVTMGAGDVFRVAHKLVKNTK